MKVALYGKSFSPELVPHYQELLLALESHHCQPVIWQPLYQKLLPHFPFAATPALFASHDELRGQVDIMLSVGGDGTMLDSVRLVRDSGIPLAGINLGRMGFLSSIPRPEITMAVEEMATGNYRIEKRTLLCLESPTGLLPDFNYAFNEVSINKKETSSMVVVHVQVDQQPVHAYWADGLIVATPTGSTAYSLSCNGPILTPASAAFVITPIAPHNLSVRPLVIPDDSLIRIRIESRDGQALLCLDARSATIGPEDEIVIRKAGFHINLLQRPGETFFSTLRAKLNWGSDIRN